MPVDERTFAAEIAGWVTEFLNGRPCPSAAPESRRMTSGCMSQRPVLTRDQDAGLGPGQSSQRRLGIGQGSRPASLERPPVRPVHMGTPFAQPSRGRRTLSTYRARLAREPSMRQDFLFADLLRGRSSCPPSTSVSSAGSRARWRPYSPHRGRSNQKGRDRFQVLCTAEPVDAVPRVGAA